jgi:AcrR family transcriptional regulator
MRQRAEQVSETRQRITEAAVRLHTTVGPANTSIASVAEEAGVTRLTVYRHFPDLESLFAACSNHWASLHPGPDVEAWLAIPDLEGRARMALGQIFGWYRKVEPELTPIRRDVASLPRANQEGMRKHDEWMADALVEGHATSGAAGRRLRAAAGHVVTFATWRSLAIDQGLDDAEAVEIGVRLLSAVRV